MWHIELQFRDVNKNIAQCSIWAKDEQYLGALVQANALISAFSGLSDGQLIQMTMTNNTIVAIAPAGQQSNVYRHLVVACHLVTGNYTLFEIPSPRLNLFNARNGILIPVIALDSIEYNNISQALVNTLDMYGVRIDSIKVAGLAI